MIGVNGPAKEKHANAKRNVEEPLSRDARFSCDFLLFSLMSSVTAQRHHERPRRHCPRYYPVENYQPEWPDEFGSKIVFLGNEKERQRAQPCARSTRYGIQYAVEFRFIFHVKLTLRESQGPRVGHAQGPINFTQNHSVGCSRKLSSGRIPPPTPRTDVIRYCYICYFIHVCVYIYT